MVATGLMELLKIIAPPYVLVASACFDISAEGSELPYASVGPGRGVVAERERQCGTLLFNAAGAYEDGYALWLGGVVPPDYGAFAECYSGPSEVRAVVFDFTQSGDQGNAESEIKEIGYEILFTETRTW